ncbi:MAG: hypothetical protein R3F29_14375 [Planctomycetota bacterium]
MSSTITNTPTPLCVIAIDASNTYMPPLALPFDMTGIADRLRSAVRRGVPGSAPPSAGNPS